MSVVLTHPWGFEHRPNLLHRLGLTPADEAGKLPFQVDGIPGEGQSPAQSTHRWMKDGGHVTGLPENSQSKCVDFQG